VAVNLFVSVEIFLLDPNFRGNPAEYECSYCVQQRTTHFLNKFLFENKIRLLWEKENVIFVIYTGNKPSADSTQSWGAK
jgi:hypothetical protein